MTPRESPFEEFFEKTYKRLQLKRCSYWLHQQFLHIKFHLLHKINVSTISQAK